MKKLILALCLSVVLVTGCAALGQKAMDTKEAVQLCLADPVCKAHAVDEAKKGASQGSLVGAAIPVPFGAAGGAIVSGGLMGLIALLKGGFALLKKKREENK